MFWIEKKNPFNSPKINVFVSVYQTDPECLSLTPLFIKLNFTILVHCLM